MRLWIIISVLWLCLAFQAGADTSIHMRTTRSAQYLISYWTTEQGLPQNTITCLLQSRDGYLWAGTRYGLARFDGVRFTAFTDELIPLGDGSLDVRGLAQDSRGCLWLNMRTGLVRCERGQFERVTLDGAPFAGSIQDFCASPVGGLWVARAKGFFHLEDGRVGRGFSVKELAGDYGGDSAEIERVFPDRAGRLWVSLSCAGGVLPLWLRVSPRTGGVESLASVIGLELSDVGGLVEDSRGRLWLGRPGELLCFEGVSSDMEARALPPVPARVPTDLKRSGIAEESVDALNARGGLRGGKVSRFSAAAAWGNHSVKRLTLDVQGRVWVISGGPAQLHRFSAGEFASYGRAEGLTNPDDVRCALPDREGNLWVGTGMGGLHRLQPRQLVTMLSGSYSTLDEVFSVSPGREGRVWLATTYGLVRFRDGEFTVFTNTAARQPEGWMLRTRTAIEDQAGNVWCGLDSGLWRLHREAFTKVEIPSLQGRQRVASLLEDRQGTLWAGTSSGLLELREGQFRLWTTNDGLSDSVTFGLVEAADGSLWAGSERGGVNHRQNGRWRAFSTAEGLLSPNAWPLRAEPDGTVWVGTPRGLNRIRGAEVCSVTMQQGLYDNLAYCLLEDRQGRYWSFCNRGIWRMNKTNLHDVADGAANWVACVAYGEADGMSSSEGNGDQQPNAAVMPNGELWFPTTRGVVILDPAQLRDNPVPPGVVIEEVRVDEETVFKDGGLANSECRNPNSETSSKSEVRSRQPPALDDAGALAPLRLAPGRARVLEIHYTANTFVDSEKARFRFRLEGHEAAWRESTPRRVALYTNLRPGSYRFQVEAWNHHGYWSESPAEFAFSLAPHFYQTWPFFVLCGFAVVGAGLGWHWRRLRAQRRLDAFRQQQALSDERSRIAKDLHDDLGANLTGIAMQIEVTRGQLSQPASAQQGLQDIAGSVRALAGQMREVVWSLDPQCDTLESFCTYACDYAESFLAAAGLRCRLDVPEKLPDHTLSAETRHHLLLVLKEALNNAARHAAATEVRISLNLDPVSTPRGRRRESAQTEANGADSRPRLRIHERASLVEQSLVLIIADDGRGFTPGPLLTTSGRDCARGDRGKGAAGENRTGHGLKNMRRRMASLGGRFTIQSKLGLGTQIIICVPLHRPPSPSKPQSSCQTSA